VGEPLYNLVASDLRRKIVDGVWAPEARLPNEAELCHRYRVSRITIRHALAILVSEGLVTRSQGSGTFVRGATIMAGLRGLSSFTEEMSALGVKTGGRVLGKTVMAATAEQARALGIAEGEPLLELRRLRTGDGTPMGIQTAYLPLTRFPGLDDEDFEGVSMYALLESNYGLQLLEAMETFRIGKVSTAEALLLGVPPASSAFVVERRTFDRQGPFELAISVMRADRYQVRLRLARF
jgi:GntR family transcriptional regulator